MKWKHFIGFFFCWIGFSFDDFIKSNYEEPIRLLVFIIIAFTLEWFWDNFELRKKNNE